MISGNFEKFQCFNFETNFLENENAFLKMWKLKILRLKTDHFHAKLPCQKPVLRVIELGVQNGPITENGVLPVTACFF